MVSRFRRPSTSDMGSETGGGGAGPLARVIISRPVRTCAHRVSGGRVPCGPAAAPKHACARLAMFGGMPGTGVSASPGRSSGRPARIRPTASATL
jgi:hypothetical protein